MVHYAAATLLGFVERTGNFLASLVLGIYSWYLAQALDTAVAIPELVLPTGGALGMLVVLWRLQKSAYDNRAEQHALTLRELREHKDQLVADKDAQLETAAAQLADTLTKLADREARIAVLTNELASCRADLAKFGDKRRPPLLDP